MNRIRRALAFLAAAWRAGGEPETCRECHRPLATAESVVCDRCLGAMRDAIDTDRERLAELDAREAVAQARAVALRDGELDLAAALQAVLLLHLTGGNLAPIAALAQPEPFEEAVN